jgi:predicted alpha/beta-fold hydrolase
MPLTTSTYRPPRLFSNPHLLTLYSGAFRPAATPFYRRERLPYAGDDFMDLDWLEQNSKKLVIITHGLTGSSRGRHVSRLAVALAHRGLSVLAWNLRGASEEINRGLGWYHSGSSEQLRAVVRHALSYPQYESMTLVGLSLGGNITLKYLGEEGAAAPAKLAAAITLSVPCDLRSCALALAAPRNRIYMNHFLRCLGRKLREKAQLYPEAIDLQGYAKIKNFLEYDERYTAPLHGFKNAAEYWRLSSSRRFIPAIKLPTTIISARDDPFLAPECFPIKEAQTNRFISLEIPPHGGHLGFVESWSTPELWSEQRAAALIATSPEPAAD